VSADDYSATEAARLLGLSPKRVRQLAAAGRLEVVQESPLRVSAVSVIAERNERGVHTQQSAAAESDSLAIARAALEELARSREALERLYQERQAISERREADLVAALADARARAETAEAALVIAQTQPVDTSAGATQSSSLTSSKRRRWYHRGHN
jgi:hypothetical protein